MFWHLYKKEMDDMKIEILSMQQINNMGSLLQAYGLMKRLKGGHNSVHFLDIKKYDMTMHFLKMIKSILIRSMKMTRSIIAILDIQYL